MSEKYVIVGGINNTSTRSHLLAGPDGLHDSLDTKWACR